MTCISLWLAFFVTVIHLASLIAPAASTGRQPSVGGLSAISSTVSASSTGAPLVVRSTSQAADAEEPLRIASVRTQRVLTFERDGQKVRITFQREGQTRVLEGVQHPSGKRKYLLSDYGFVAEVKSKQSGFKVRDQWGRLLWKVKTSPQKVKIADDEELTQPYELVRKPAGRLKVRRLDVALGAVRVSSDRGQVAVFDATGAMQYQSATPHLSVMYGVLLLEAIPELERYMIMAELWLRNQ
jgi:hypothetical protein